jgi:glyoxylate/hydroxypyruvate/2-ketogluconate reductase
LNQRPAILIARAVFPEVVERLREHFEVETNPTDEPFSAAQLVERLQGKVGAFTTGSERIDAELLAACPDLKVVRQHGRGLQQLRCARATAAWRAGTNTPDVLTETTADFGFALLMATARRVTESEHFLRAGQWNRWALDMFAGAEVHGSTLGILGMGRIGQAIARRGAHGFGMKVIYHNRSRLGRRQRGRLQGQLRQQGGSAENQADHVVLVLPYTPEAHHTVAAAELARMKPTATLVNIARGGIVDENALVAALREKRIAAAGLDVFEGEPAVNPALLTVPNVVLTPHIASATIPHPRWPWPCWRPTT